MSFDRYIRCAIVTAVLTASAILSSCVRSGSQDIEVPVQSGMSVGFRISLGEPEGSQSRSGSYDDGRGTEYENYIDFINNDYCVMFFDTSNRYLARFLPTDLIPVEDDPLRSRFYDAIGKIDWSVNVPFPSDFKIVIMANWHTYPSEPVVGETSVDDICNGTASRYEYVAPFVLSAENTIPMFGIKQYTGVSLTPDMLTYLGTVCMLRAMAKVEVAFPENGRDWTIDKVSLLRYNHTGFCAPDKVYDETDYVKGSYDADYADALHIMDDTVANEELTFHKVADGRYAVYIPEYRNTISDGRSRRYDAAEIRVTFEERKDTNYFIDFKYYDNPPTGYSVGDWFDIRRNYYYRFTISKNNEYDDNLKIAIDVDPYDEYKLDPVFGVDK